MSATQPTRRGILAPSAAAAAASLSPEHLAAAPEAINGVTCTGLPTPSAPAAHLFGRTVEISPIDAVKRHSTGRYEMLIESIYVPAQRRIECRFRAPSNLLVMYDEG